MDHKSTQMRNVHLLKSNEIQRVFYFNKFLPRRIFCVITPKVFWSKAETSGQWWPFITKFRIKIFSHLMQNPLFRIH